MKNIFAKFLGISAFGIVLSAPVAHAAGPVSFSLKGGATMSSSSAAGSKMGIGFLGGLGVDVGAGPIGVQVDAFYAKRKIGVADSTQTIAGQDFAITNASISMTQLFVPIQLRFALMPMLRLTAGGYFASGLGKVSSSASVAGISLPAVEQEYAAAGIEKTDYGLIGGLGVAAGPLLVGGHYYYGLKKGAGNAKASGFDLTIGFEF